MGRGASGAGGKGGGGGAAQQKQQEFVPIDGKAVGADGIYGATNTEQWENNLTNAELQAISSYTGSGYSDLNDNLRKGKNLDAYDQKIMDGLDSAIAKAELKEPIVLYRGSTNDLVGYSSISDIQQNVVGHTVKDLGFMSTSVSKSGSFKHKPMLYRITVPAGKGRGAYINKQSGYKNIEYEFLLKRGTNFMVTGVSKSKSSGQPVVYLQVVD